MEYLITELSTLPLQNSYRDDIYVFINEKDCNNVQRHSTYCQFKLWQYQYLDAHDRHLVSSYCLWKIQHKFLQHKVYHMCIQDLDVISNHDIYDIYVIYIWKF